MALVMVGAFAYPLLAQETSMATGSSTSTGSTSGTTTGTTSTSTQASNQILPLLSSEGKIIFGNEPNSVMVIDYPDNLQRIAEFLEVMDTPPPQVVIEARVVEVKLQGEHALGVNWTLVASSGKTSMSPWGFGPYKLLSPVTQNIPYKATNYPPVTGTVETGAAPLPDPFTLTIFDANINIVLQTLANHLKTNILSAPRITTVNNRDAEMKVVQNLPWAEPTVTVSDTGITVTWSMHFEEVGITLKVKPTITEDGNISMVLSPEVSEHISDYPLYVLSGTTRLDYTVPVIDKRTASTKVVIGNNQTLIIGGLIKDKTTKGMTKIPFLGDIPYLGKLFGSSKDTTDKTELLIFVSPTIITPEEFARHAREERFGVAKEFTQEREAKEKKTRLLDENEKLRRESAQSAALLEAQEGITIGAVETGKLETMLQKLESQQESLSGERRKLEEALANEETEYKKLQLQENSLIQQRKQLEQGLGGALPYPMER